jgi:hypothetical protein
MNARLLSFGFVAGTILGAPAAALAARVNPDVPPPQKRQATISAAERLTKRPSLPPVPATTASPFNPPDFNKPDPSAAPVSSAPASGAQPSTAPVRMTDRIILETLAAQIAPSGVMMVRGTPRLVIGPRPFEVGTRFTASYNNEDYELELVAIDRTTFTLRYRGEEITRPIKPVR